MTIKTKFCSLARFEIKVLPSLVFTLPLLFCRTLSNYMIWTFVRSVIPYLSRNFREAYLDFQKATQGKKQAKPRWLSCVEDMNSYTHGLTFAMGYMWIQSAFDVKMIPLVSNNLLIRNIILQESGGKITASFSRKMKDNYDWNVLELKAVWVVFVQHQD